MKRHLVSFGLLVGTMAACADAQPTDQQLATGDWMCVATDEQFLGVNPGIQATIKLSADGSMVLNASAKVANVDGSASLTATWWIAEKILRANNVGMTLTRFVENGREFTQEELGNSNAELNKHGGAPSELALPIVSLTEDQMLLESPLENIKCDRQG